MIIEVKGDILFSDAEAIAHGVAPMDKFQSGLALELRKNHPSMVKDFRHFCRNRHPKEGNIWLWQGVGENGQTVKIFNLLTQQHPPSQNAQPGRAKVEYVRQTLKNLAQRVQKEGIKSLAVPKLATGVGALDWKDVKPLLMEYLDPLRIPVFVYSTYVAGQKAKESNTLT